MFVSFAHWKRLLDSMERLEHLEKRQLELMEERKRELLELVELLERKERREQAPALQEAQKDEWLQEGIDNILAYQAGSRKEERR